MDLNERSAQACEWQGTLNENKSRILTKLLNIVNGEIGRLGSPNDGHITPYLGVAGAERCRVTWRGVLPKTLA